MNARVMAAQAAAQDRRLFRETPLGYVRLPVFILNPFLVAVWAKPFRASRPRRRA